MQNEGNATDKFTAFIVSIVTAVTCFGYVKRPSLIC